MWLSMTCCLLRKEEKVVVAAQVDKRDEGETSPTGPRGRKNPHRDDINFKKQSSSKQTAVYTDQQFVWRSLMSATELLNQIRLHSSLFGDGNQILAHCFADGLEARLAGTGVLVTQNQ
ncbi:hypothetical protein RDI58_009248 [Solanum bulbocastanum]|uniref:Uncharacterized protein n=1 Tax=Solanum bulbocastanum TaxID=147425 RepID=A0AAN8YNZ8_SOLBU